MYGFQLDLKKDNGRIIPLFTQLYKEHLSKHYMVMLHRICFLQKETRTPPTMDTFLKDGRIMT